MESLWKHSTKIFSHFFTDQFLIIRTLILRTWNLIKFSSPCEAKNRSEKTVFLPWQQQAIVTLKNWPDPIKVSRFVFVQFTELRPETINWNFHSRAQLREWNCCRFRVVTQFQWKWLKLHIKLELHRYHWNIEQLGASPWIVKCELCNLCLVLLGWFSHFLS